jgi:hypothetical protein
MAKLRQGGAASLKTQESSLRSFGAGYLPQHELPERIFVTVSMPNYQIRIGRIRWARLDGPGNGPVFIATEDSPSDESCGMTVAIRIGMYQQEPLENRR